MAEETPLTQQALLEEQQRLVGVLNDQVATLHGFLNKPAGETVQTESGSIPSLRGVIEQIRLQSGYRTYTVDINRETLGRYAGGAEALGRIVHLIPVYVSPGLPGAAFRLGTTTAQAVDLDITWGSATFKVRFAANSDTGVVVDSSISEPTLMPAGTMVTVKVNGAVWTAAGLVMAIPAQIDLLPDVAG